MKNYARALPLLCVTMLLSGCSKPTPTPPPNPSPITISLQARDANADETGAATLNSTTDNQTAVSIAMKNEPAGETQYVFFQNGTCDQLTPSPVYPLADLVNNKSDYSYKLPFGFLVSEGPGDSGGRGPGGEGAEGVANPAPPPTSFAIAVWRYTKTGTTLLSCGESAIGTPR
jgi:hypothetical protein